MLQPDGHRVGAGGEVGEDADVMECPCVERLWRSETGRYLLETTFLEASQPYSLAWLGSKD